MKPLDDKQGAERSGFWMLTGVLAFLCLLVRMRNLTGSAALPLFSDEAIYLRWAQLIRDGHWWVSLVDPKPPLHFWLIALIYRWTGDPLTAARGLSVVAGVLTIPGLMLVCEELGYLVRVREVGVTPPPSRQSLGIVTGVMAIFCPFLAFYQRFAVAEALFVLEMTVGVWASLAWARALVDGRRASACVLAVGIGGIMGLALLTRQGLSYTLCMMPAVAWGAHWVRTRAAKTFGITLVQGIMAGAIALVIWSPYLVAEMPKWRASYQEEAPAGTNVGTWGVMKRRIFYQDQFTANQESRWDITRKNFAATFVPSWSRVNRQSIPEAGWLWFYLTPPVYCLCVAGVLWLMVRREWGALTVLLGWIVLMLGPLIGVLSVLRSRYEIGAVVPLLIAGAWAVVDWMNLLFSREWRGAMRVVPWVSAAVILAGVVVWPLREIGLQLSNPQSQVLTRQDRYQYLTGWTAGTPTMKALAALKAYAKSKPVVLLTGDEWGIPADAAWVYLGESPGVEVYYTKGVMGRPRALEPTEGEFTVFKDKYLYTPAIQLKIPSEAAVFYICNDRIEDPEENRPPHVLNRLNANFSEPVTFYGIEDKGGSDAVDLFAVGKGNTQ